MIIKRQTSGPSLSAVFVDYDNIYMSLKRKSEEAARRFARDAGTWIKAIETGSLITPTNGPVGEETRRIVMNRCYGNPVPRRNQTDNSTDMSSFPFVRHHFLRAGFEIIDCPPLTAQLKNSSDIRMVMDVIDFLSHGTYFDEFVILSGDADFTPVLHRLRAHARRTVIYANEYTATPYTAISDGEVREVDLVALLLQGQGETALPMGTVASLPPVQSDADRDAARQAIISEVATLVRASPAPVPLEALADRAVRLIGHDRTVATSWAGAGGFRELLSQSLPEDLRISDQPPYVVMDVRRHLQPAVAAPAQVREPARPLIATEPELRQPAARAEPVRAPIEPEVRPERRLMAPEPVRQSVQEPAPAPAAAAAPPYQAPAARATEPAAPAVNIQQSITRIHEACQAPPLAPGEYRALFEVMAQEINENNLLGAQTIQNILRRAQERGLELRRDDVRFVMEVVSETDPWFEQGASANLFAGRFRNFVVARCRGQGLKLSADELDLIEAWFTGQGSVAAPAAHGNQRTAHAAPRPAAPSYAEQPQAQQQSTVARAPQAPPAARPAEPATDAYSGDELPRIVRSGRFKG